MQITWELKKFEELTPQELYAAMRLRSEVFVVEQNCVYLDADDNDQQCHHLLGSFNDKLIAYTRIVPPGVFYPQPSIGRVVTSPSVRRMGAGRILMMQSLNAVYGLYGEVPVKIGAQLYLKEFYESFGFRQESETYLEDGIPHIYMIKGVSS
jgi:ElaA protein